MAIYLKVAESATVRGTKCSVAVLLQEKRILHSITDAVEQTN